MYKGYSGLIEDSSLLGMRVDIFDIHVVKYQ